MIQYLNHAVKDLRRLRAAVDQANAALVVGESRLNRLQSGALDTSDLDWAKELPTGGVGREYRTVLCVLCRERGKEKLVADRTPTLHDQAYHGLPRIGVPSKRRSPSDYTSPY